MATRTVISLQARKEQLARKSDALREDLRVDLEQVEPALRMLEKGYDLAHTAGSVWNLMAPLRQAKNGGWSISQLLLNLVRSRFDR